MWFRDSSSIGCIKVCFLVVERRRKSRKMKFFLVMYKNCLVRKVFILLEKD